MAEDYTPNTFQDRVLRTGQDYVDANIAAAMKLANKRLNDGTASAQEIMFFARLGTPQAQLELENAKLQSDLLKAKTEATLAASKNEVDFKSALEAFKGYQPSDDGVIEGDFREA